MHSRGIPTPRFGDAERPPSQHAVRVRNVDRDREPEVLLSLWTGGAHCCAATEVFDYVQTRHRYRVTTRVWADQTFERLLDVNSDGVIEFVGADGRFCFSCRYPSIAYPIQVMHFRAGRFVDVTSSFPRLIQAEARILRRGLRPCFRRGPRSSCTPAVDEWVADEVRLGHGTAAFRFVHELGLSRRYATGLRRYLRKLGYVPP